MAMIEMKRVNVFLNDIHIPYIYVSDSDTRYDLITSFCKFPCHTTIDVKNDAQIGCWANVLVDMSSGIPEFKSIIGCNMPNEGDTYQLMETC